MGFLSILLGRRHRDRLRRTLRRPGRIHRIKLSGLRLEPLEERHLLTVLYWDPNHSGGTNLGGTGNWVGSNNWWDGTNNVSWTSGDDARVNISGSGSAGTV